MTKDNSNPFKSKNEEEDKEINIEDNVQEPCKDEQTEESDIKGDSETTSSDLQKKFDVLNQQYVRLAADFDNYRKRQAQERESLLNYGTESALTKLIEVLDNFERGKKSLENVEDIEKVKESFDLLYKQVSDTLSKMGLEEIKAIGEEFDPNFHEAVMRTPTDEHPENIVIQELRKGYKFGDKVLRPTMVNVAGTN